MLSINYAKKSGSGYILNFYADTVQDIENFDPTTSFGRYGIPLTGSVVTLVGGDKAANYYLSDQGTFVKIEIGGDEPTPGEFITFEDGKSYSGIDFGNVINGETSDTIDEFLGGLSYEDSQHILLFGDLGDGTDYFVSAIYAGEGAHALMAGSEGGVTILYCDIDDVDFGNKGWKNLENGKFLFSPNFNVSLVNDTNPPVWNGILFGSVPVS